MNSEDIQPAPAIFRGDVKDATYAQQLVGRYKGNPTIEALPRILSAEDAMKLLAFYPEKEHGSHKLPPEIRMHMIMDAVHFFQPLPVHIDLEQRLSRVIRDGYVGRNPVARDHWQEIDRRVATVRKSGGIPMRSSNTIGFSIVGMPGVGKTTGVERILQIYPQAIHHTTYGGQPFSRTQLVWLKLTCPHDGSIKGLCLDFFREVDGLLGTQHYRDYAGGGRRTVDELIPNMFRVGWIHCLGLLVIDEIQHLNQAKSGGAEKMLNFFLQLMNTLGVPVVLIGTYGAMEVLSRELRQIRRSCGQGDLVWDRMAKDDVWQLFAESLWRYQYTKSQVALNQELSDVLHDESAGIIDFAVKLFFLAQARAISTGVEKLSPAILASVAKDSLRLAQPALRAIRTGDMRAVATMTDLHPIDFQSAVQNLRKDSLLREFSKGTQMVSDINATAALSPVSDIPCTTTSRSEEAKCGPRPGAKVNAKPRRGAKREAESKCLLVQIANAGLSKNTCAHDALAQGAIIKTPFPSQNSLP